MALWRDRALKLALCCDSSAHADARVLSDARMGHLSQVHVMLRIRIDSQPRGGCQPKREPHSPVGTP